MGRGRGCWTRHVRFRRLLRLRLIHGRHTHISSKHSGASVARKFAQSYSVALLARKPENYEPIVNEINNAGGHAVGISTDTSDKDSVKKAFTLLKEQIGQGKLVAAIYNVGGRFIRKPFLELSDEEFESGWEANG
jgi:NADP-dependent 3-hydroxy acid dehydrogenase YdfG